MLARNLTLSATLMLGLLTTSVEAAADEPLRFQLIERAGDQVQLAFDHVSANNHQGFSSEYHSSELIGLSSAALDAPTRKLVTFSLVAASGAITCAGNALRGHANGSCAFRQDPAFGLDLRRHGYALPSVDEALALTALRFDPEVLNALDAVGFQRGKTANLAALAVFHIDAREVRSFAGAGYRPNGLDSLAQLKVLGVTPQFISRFTRAGFRDLSDEQLVQLKIFNVTPEYVRTVESQAGRRLSPGEVVQRKLVGVGQ